MLLVCIFKLQVQCTHVAPSLGGHERAAGGLSKKFYAGKVLRCPYGGISGRCPLSCFSVVGIGLAVCWLVCFTSLGVGYGGYTTVSFPQGFHTKFAVPFLLWTDLVGVSRCASFKYQTLGQVIYLS